MNGFRISQVVPFPNLISRFRCRRYSNSVSIAAISLLNRNRIKRLLESYAIPIKIRKEEDENDKMILTKVTTKVVPLEALCDEGVV